MTESRIIQIIPADGWVAEYDEDGTVTRCPLVCWALFDDGEVVGIDTDDLGWVDTCKGVSNFLRYVKVEAWEKVVS